MNMLKKIVSVSVLAGTLALSGGQAMAATAAPQTSPTPVATVAASSAQVQELAAAAAGIGYTFDHETTVQIFNLVQSGATTAAVGACNLVVPAPANAVCPLIGAAAASLVGMGAPGPNDKLYVGAQLGWPPVVFEYVQ